MNRSRWKRLLYLTYEELTHLTSTPSRVSSLSKLYLTYEELTRVFSTLAKNSLFCCTLPMRNWHLLLIFLHLSYYFSSFLVVPYLWGIDTFNYKNFFHSIALRCTLPMRNWHILDKMHILYFRFSWNVVPYLWGIDTCCPQC